MLPIKFQLNPTYSLRGVVVWRISTILDIRTEWYWQLWISITLQYLPSSFSSIPQGLGNVVWRILRWLPWRPFWTSEWMVLAILNLNDPQMPPTNFQLYQTYRSGADLVWKFQDGRQGGHLGYQNRITSLNLHAALMPSFRFQLNLTYPSRADNNWRFPRIS